MFKTSKTGIVIASLILTCSLAACSSSNQASNRSSNSSDQASFRPIDLNSDANSPAFADGYIALKNGDNFEAARKFQTAYAEMPSDPYDALNLGAAYQNTNSIDRALPLYRQVIASPQGGTYPADVTKTAVQGMNLEQIAKWNMRLGGYDENGARLTTVSTTVPMAAASAAPMTYTRSSPIYQVYFDFDKSDLSSASKALLRTAAANAKQGSSIRITITGHTDTSGSAAYNQGLSQRRAAAVANEMVADGISRLQIVTRAEGESGLLVPTADGVREPQNRRVEIVTQEVPNS